MLSAVIPVRDELESLRDLHGELADVAAENHYDLEIIFIDDGSTDRTIEVARAQESPDVVGDPARSRRTSLSLAALPSIVRVPARTVAV